MVTKTVVDFFYIYSVHGSEGDFFIKPNAVDNKALSPIWADKRITQASKY